MDSERKASNVNQCTNMADLMAAVIEQTVGCFGQYHVTAIFGLLLFGDCCSQDPSSGLTHTF